MSSTRTLPINIKAIRNKRSSSVPNLLEIESSLNNGAGIVKSISTSPLMSSSAPTPSSLLSTQIARPLNNNGRSELIPVLNIEKKAHIINDVVHRVSNEQKVPQDWDITKVTERIFDHTASESALYLSLVRSVKEQEQSPGTNVVIHGKFSDFSVFKFIGEKADLPEYGYATDNLFLVSEPELPERKVTLRNRKNGDQPKSKPFNIKNGVVYIIACCGYKDALSGELFARTLENYAKLMPKKIHVVLGQYDNPLVSPEKLAELAPQYQKDWLQINSAYLTPDFLQSLNLESYPDVSIVKITELYNTLAFYKAEKDTIEILSKYTKGYEKLTNDVKSYVNRQISIYEKEKKVSPVIKQPKTSSSTANIATALQQMQPHKAEVRQDTKSNTQKEFVTVIIWDLLVKQAFQHYTNPHDTVQFSIQAARDLGLLSIGSDSCSPELITTLLKLHANNPSKTQQSAILEFKDDQSPASASVRVSASQSHLPSGERPQTPQSSLHTLSLHANLNVSSPKTLFKSLANPLSQQQSNDSTTNNNSIAQLGHK